MTIDLFAHEWLLLAALVEHVPLRIEAIELRLPDGSSITLSLEGDEYSLVAPQG